MSKNGYRLLIIVLMIAAAIVDYMLKEVLPLWARAPIVGLSVGLAVLLIGLLYGRKKERGVQ